MLSFRRERDVIDSLPLPRVIHRSFYGVLPWRAFTYRQGQTHRPGLYWAATSERHVPYESGLELSVLLTLDRDPEVRRILSQPFRMDLNGSDERWHVPDFYVEGADGSVRVIEVKPTHRLKNRKVRDALGWAQSELQNHGWAYEVRSETPAQEALNLRFLAGYRRAWQFHNILLDCVRQETTEQEVFRALEWRISEATGVSKPVVRSHLLHLLWRGDLVADLSLPLDVHTLLAPGRRQ
ncbi:TnsA-like heteromeric transposase endonuclease subunit [Arthrobacter sp. NPDC089319]|uniref:TnsA-like heteromeric transposase endonuclease subunit n=1 Tax=Arthrobacter sp. NPDC089319 TaxID=3155915 RepID=UPI0034297D46